MPPSLPGVIRSPGIMKWASTTVWTAYELTKTAAWAAVVRLIPVFMRPIWTAKRSPRERSGQPSPGRIRRAPSRRVHHAYARTVIPPRTKRMQARRKGGASASPILTATGLQPQSAASIRAITAPLRSRERSGGTGRHVSMRPHEDRTDRTAEERKDVAVQSADGLERGDVVLWRLAGRDAHRHRAGARRARGSPERALQAEEDDLRDVRGRGPGGHRQG